MKNTQDNILVHKDEIARLYTEDKRLRAEVERLKREVHEAEQKAMACYLDKELEIERLEATNQELKSQLESTTVELEQLRIEVDTLKRYAEAILKR